GWGSNCGGSRCPYHCTGACLPVGRSSRTGITPYSVSAVSAASDTAPLSARGWVDSLSTINNRGSPKALN
ncbi:MAG TPA: hypothetical protein VLL95_06435, partial [Phnomibacter sp.]|nr:hypothetical protein [Phnomibacter sp.]